MGGWFYLASVNFGHMLLCDFCDEQSVFEMILVVTEAASQALSSPGGVGTTLEQGHVHSPAVFCDVCFY